MIKQKTARAMLYDWHDGQWSATYAAASSGLVGDINALIGEVSTISFQPDREKLLTWLLKQIELGRHVCVGDTSNPANYYLALPWAER